LKKTIQEWKGESANHSALKYEKNRGPKAKSLVTKRTVLGPKRGKRTINGLLRQRPYQWKKVNVSPEEKEGEARKNRVSKSFGGEGREGTGALDIDHGKKKKKKKESLCIGSLKVTPWEEDSEWPKGCGFPDGGITYAVRG